MNKEEFLKYLNSGNLIAILYHYHLDNGKVKFTFQEFKNNINDLLLLLQERAFTEVDIPRVTIGDLIRFSIEYYMDKLSVGILTINSKLIKYC